MSFDTDFLTRLKNTHTLQQHFNFSLTEINALTPWELDVRMTLILQDQEEEKKARSRGRSQPF